MFGISRIEKLADLVKFALLIKKFLRIFHYDCIARYRVNLKVQDAHA